MEGNDLTELTQDSFKQRVEEACIIVENAGSMCEWQYVSKPDIVVYTLVFMLQFWFIILLTEIMHWS